MKLVYANEKEQKTYTFCEMKDAALAGEVWCSISRAPNGGEFYMYAMIVLIGCFDPAKRKAVIIESGGKLVELGDVGYNEWIKVPVSEVRFVK